MNFINHSDLRDRHAFLSPSRYHWVNYNDEKLEHSYLTALAKEKGTRLHKFAEDAISLGIEQKNTKKTLNMYINDCIGFRMKTEQILYYSPNAFGSADAISFRRNKLRIFDLKTGVTPASIKQLEVYAALFCLEYKYSPKDIEIELRIYQLNDINKHYPDPEDILFIMNRIMEADKYINNLNLMED